MADSRGLTKGISLSPQLALNGLDNKGSDRNVQQRKARGNYSTWRPDSTGIDNSQLSQDLPTGLETLERDRLGVPTVPFTRPHASLDQFTDDLTQSLKRAFLTDPKSYDNVHVLLIRWAEDDLGTEKEITDLDEVFCEKYHYTTERGLIPSQDSYDTLERMIRRFRDSHDSPNNLLILYYGGHGARESNKSTWAAKGSSPSPSVNWSEIQPVLLRSQADVLLLLDCCYASSVGTRGVSHGAKEVLAACSMEDVTTGVHDNSFTRILIEELRHGAQEGVTTWALNGRLMARRTRDELLYTPRHFPLRPAATSTIKLRPLGSSSKLHLEHDPHGSQGESSIELATPALSESASTLPTEDATMFFENRILLSINLRDWTIPPSPEEWYDWLGRKAPRNIESVNARFQPPTRRRGSDRTTDAQNPRIWAESVPTLEEPGRKRRVKGVLVRSESAFDSHSTLLLVSVPLPLWTFLPDNPAYSFVGFITSGNRLNSRQLSRSNSMSELTKVAAEIDRQHWWYKWFLGLAFFAVVSSPWRPWLVVVQLSFGFITAISLPLISLFRRSSSNLD